MIKEFKEFAIKGNAVELAVGIVVGAAFTSIVNSLVNDLITPILSMLTGHVNLSNLTLGLPGKSVLKYGSFLNSVINFVIVSFAVFLLVKQINRFRRNPNAVPSEKECKFCFTKIPIKATRCPHCTTQLG